MSDRPLGAEEIKSLLHEVAGEMADGTGQTIVMVGGALLSLRGLRQATRDVDTTTTVKRRAA